MWEMLAGAALGGLLGGGESGGSQSVNRDPWAPAQPWLKNLLEQGQSLQGQYSANPFNPVQQGAYKNQFSGLDYLNQITPGLLAQITQPVGFDRANPRAKPGGYTLPAMPAMTPMGGLLDASFQQAKSAGQMPAPAPAAVPPASLYTGDDAMRQFWATYQGAGG